MVLIIIRKTFFYSALIFIVSHLFYQCTFTRFAERSYRNAKISEPFDVIIVPGIPYDKDKTSSIMKMRVYWAKLLYDSAIAKNIIFSGSSVYTPYVEGVVLKIISDSLGIPGEHTFAETKAEHSTENVYYSWRLAQSLGFERIALATDPFQARMLQGFIKKHTPGVAIVPVVFSMMDHVKDKELPEINANTAFVSDFVSIKKRESWWQRMRGTFGKRVIEEKKEEEQKRKTQDLARD